MPRCEPGDDVSPADVFVNSALRAIVRGTDIPDVVRVRQEAAAAPQRMGERPKFRDGLKRAIESEEPRLRSIAANGGREIPKRMKF